MFEKVNPSIALNVLYVKIQKLACMCCKLKN